MAADLMLPAFVITQTNGPADSMRLVGGRIGFVMLLEGAEEEKGFV